MKKIKLLVFSPLLFLVLLYPYVFDAPEQEKAITPTAPIAQAYDAAETSVLPAPVTALKPKKVMLAKEKSKLRKHLSTASPKELVSYALSLLGKPYVYGGTSANGFDCSGFTSHVFTSFGVDVSRSSSTQAHDGQVVAKEEAKPGDLVIFTGTNPSDRNPGHVGIVISEPGDTIAFVHSSSNGGVKISKVEGTGYDRRFLQIRRVL